VLGGDLPWATRDDGLTGSVVFGGAKGGDEPPARPFDQLECSVEITRTSGPGVGHLVVVARGVGIEPTEQADLADVVHSAGETPDRGKVGMIGAENEVRGAQHGHIELSGAVSSRPPAPTGKGLHRARIGRFATVTGRGPEGLDDDVVESRRFCHRTADNLGHWRTTDVPEANHGDVHPAIFTVLAARSRSPIGAS